MCLKRKAPHLFCFCLWSIFLSFRCFCFRSYAIMLPLLSFPTIQISIFLSFKLPITTFLLSPCFVFVFVFAIRYCGELTLNAQLVLFLLYHCAQTQRGPLKEGEMPICPGLCGELAAVPFRVFLGTLPTLAVEERFLRQLQPVFAWYSSRKRVKEQANEFIEIDLASCDAELLLRYSHIYYVRRQLFDELIERQMTLLDSGKAPKMAEPSLLQCLAGCNMTIADRLQLEIRQLGAAKRAASVPGRRELDPVARLEVYDYACMMRLVEEDAGAVGDAEMKARAYLPREVIESKLGHLTQLLLGSDARAALDKKDVKLLNRMIPPDYTRVGCVEKLRPFDVTAYFRFYGERINNVKVENYFKRALWGHVYRRFATTPSFLSGVSTYWARHSGLDASFTTTTMPQEVAVAVCDQQIQFPAIKFRAQYVYTSPETARQLWRTDAAVPLMRLFPLMGSRTAEDLAAGVLTDAFWMHLGLSEEENLLQDSLLLKVRRFVDEVGDMYETNIDSVLKRVDDNFKQVVPQLKAEDLQVDAPLQDGEGEDTVRETVAA
uniref:mL70 n=1 Tax=Trypanosoma brucei brucei TaxID=5702 RepID=UPI000E6AE3DD|nr:Chain BD, mL70 [Trypanosoma brucei brucei]6HIX_BD Chain BD, mL70 [Trypanosoma brucei brucei]6YXX_BD Chain BD, mL70 [Trypanosoma brucei brucei]6YXY_BD Chain BD, mL70 [Trypanosoma brucei brucei]